MEHIYDVVIIGGGPAGYTAALYCVRAGLDTVVLEKLSAGGQMATTEQIDNYPGFEEGVDGFALAQKMQQQAERFGAKPELARQVLNNSLKTEIRFTINMRSARNFFDLRCDVAAHPHMKQIAIPMLLFLQEKVPVLFDDIKYDKKFADKYLKNWRDMVSVKEIGG